MCFVGKIIVITGAASGIGKSLVDKFVKLRSIVISVDIKFQNKKIDNHHFQIKCDLSSKKQIIKLFDFLEKNFDSIDYFFSNAGILSIGDENILDREWDKNIKVNLLSHVYIAQNLIKKYRSQGYGHLIITASAAGLLTHLDSASYSVTKHATVAFAEWLAINNIDYGIKISIVCPQAVKTNMILGRENDIASIDGILEPLDVSNKIIEDINNNKFLILPHNQVDKYIKNKVNNYENWLIGMSKLKKKISKKT